MSHSMNHSTNSILQLHFITLTALYNYHNYHGWNKIRIHVFNLDELRLTCLYRLSWRSSLVFFYVQAVQYNIQD